MLHCTAERSSYPALDGTNEGAPVSGVPAPEALAQEVLGEEQVLPTH